MVFATFIRQALLLWDRPRDVGTSRKRRRKIHRLSSRGAAQVRRPTQRSCALRSGGELSGGARRRRKNLGALREYGQNPKGGRARRPKYEVLPNDVEIARWWNVALPQVYVGFVNKGWLSASHPSWQSTSTSGTSQGFQRFLVAIFMVGLFLQVLFCNLFPGAARRAATSKEPEHTFRIVRTRSTAHEYSYPRIICPSIVVLLGRAVLIERTEREN